MDLTRARVQAHGYGHNAAVQSAFEGFNETSTVSLAHWLAGDGVQMGRIEGKSSWHFYGELAARRAASLQEVTERCLCWREAVAEVLEESAEQVKAPSSALAEALKLLQWSADFCLVRTCAAFDAERVRTDEALAKREAELAFQTTHDELTGLPNRTLILDRVEQMLARHARKPAQAAALIIDVDNFKAVNDTLGRAAGDELLQAIAARLDGLVRGNDTLGRLGGNEFVVICDELSLQAGPELIAERLLGAFATPFTVQGKSCPVSASMGIATGTRRSAEELLRDADTALQRAKWEGKNHYTLFEADMQDAVHRRGELEMDLRFALDRNEFFLVYQPIFALDDLRPTGVEALIRWKHPSRGLVGPLDFIPLTEDMGFITKIGRWVLREACLQGAAWWRAGLSLEISVNVSARQLDSDQLVVDVEKAIREGGLTPRALTLEITETALMRNVEETVRRLLAVKALGVRIAIDDFGTGYSSLAHLSQFPVDALKIDRSFVSRSSETQTGQTFLHTLIELGKALSIETIAEGIEDPDQLARLRAEHCDQGQGFLYARPLPVGDVEVFVREAASAPVRSLDGASTRLKDGNLIALGPIPPASSRMHRAGFSPR